MKEWLLDPDTRMLHLHFFFLSGRLLVKGLWPGFRSGFSHLELNHWFILEGFKKWNLKLSVVIHTCCPSTREAELEDGELEASLSCRVQPCFKTTQNTQNRDCSKAELKTD